MDIDWFSTERQPKNGKEDKKKKKWYINTQLLCMYRGCDL